MTCVWRIRNLTHNVDNFNMCNLNTYFFKSHMHTKLGYLELVESMYMGVNWCAPFLPLSALYESWLSLEDLVQTLLNLSTALNMCTPMSVLKYLYGFWRSKCSKCTCWNYQHYEWDFRCVKILVHQSYELISQLGSFLGQHQLTLGPSTLHFELFRHVGNLFIPS